MNAPVQQFNPSQIAIIDHNGGKWLTAEQLGLALGFSPSNANDGVGRLYRRHLDEFSEKDTTTVNLTVQGQGRKTRIFSHSGCNLLSFFANTPNAKAFRAWAKVRLAEPAAARPGGRINAEQAAVLRGMAAELSERSGEPPTCPAPPTPRPAPSSAVPPPPHPGSRSSPPKKSAICSRVPTAACRTSPCATAT